MKKKLRRYRLKMVRAILTCVSIVILTLFLAFKLEKVWAQAIVICIALIVNFVLTIFNCARYSEVITRIKFEQRWRK